MPSSASNAPREGRLTDVFAVREFRALYAARTLSLIGDQLARVALAVLVFDRTKSAALTGVVYALTFLPHVAGLFLGGVADRRPRRAVMIAADLVSLVAVAAMALPGLPLLALIVLLICATIVSPMYDAARAAVLPDVLEGDLYVLGSAVTNMTFAAVQILGFGVGGALIAVIGPRGALAVDALTFALSAALLVFCTKHRPAASNRKENPWQQLRAGGHLVFNTPQLRALIWLAYLNALWVVPEGLAAPYAADLGGGPAVVGLLLAAGPVGAVTGGALIAKYVRPANRGRATTPLALLAAAPLIVVVAHPGVAGSFILLALSGVGTAYNLSANTEFMRALPSERRGQGFAIASVGIMTGQGIAVVLAGALASLWGAGFVIAFTGAFGLGLVAAVRIGAWHAHRRADATHSGIDDISIPADGILTAN